MKIYVVLVIFTEKSGDGMKITLELSLTLSFVSVKK